MQDSSARGVQFVQTGCRNSIFETAKNEAKPFNGLEECRGFGLGWRLDVRALWTTVGHGSETGSSSRIQGAANSFALVGGVGDCMHVRLVKAKRKVKATDKTCRLAFSSNEKVMLWHCPSRAPPPRAWRGGRRI